MTAPDRRLDWDGARHVRDLGGLPVEPAVTRVLEAKRAVFKDLGCVIEEAEPDFSGATEAFESLRKHLVKHIEPETKQERKAPGLARTKS